MKKIIKDIIKKLPPIKSIIQERDQLRAELNALKRFVPPGHFYSPIPGLDEIKRNEERIFGHIPRSIPGIDLNEKEQLRLLNKFKDYYKELPFESHKTDNLRYFFENAFYTYSDAIFLYCMLRYVKPKQIIEVGSGYSSCLILDTNALFFNNSIQCTFIDPFPQRLVSLIHETDKEKITLIAKQVQDVALDEFVSLSEGDILVIDSSHVSKVGSDVHYIFFEILPHLKKGVYTHFHDIFYPFEYPREWIYEGRAWNENYLLRAFLQYNTSFTIVFFNTFLEYFYKSRFVKEMPLCMKNTGASIWIRKEK